MAVPKPLRIAVNTRFLIKGNLEGIGLFTAETLERIVKAHPETEFHFLFDRHHSSSFLFGPNVKPVVLPPPARHPLLWFIWFEVSVAFWLWRNKPDLFLSPDGFLCLSSSVPQVGVIHDIAFEHYPEQVPLLARWYYRFFFPRFARKATRIATVSEFSKKDIINKYNISSARIDVVYNGAKDVYRPTGEPEKVQMRGSLTGGAPYFIYVGSVHPRKNIGMLLRAFDTFKKQTGGNEKLVLVGRKAWQYDDVEAVYQAMAFRKDVIFTGHLESEQLARVLAAAAALVYVSLFEGFGIPILEAFKCGVPVITSHSTSMPEVAADAALLVNPRSEAEIAAAMHRICADSSLRDTLIESGLNRLKHFSWQQSADLLWKSCLKAMNWSARQA